MIFWLSVLVMLGAAVLSLLIPLARKGRPLGVSYSSQYREKLEELEAQILESPDDEALSSERAKIARGLIASNEAEHNALRNNQQVKIAAALILAVIPACALAIYSYSGSPKLPDAPLAARLADNVDVLPMDALVRRAEAHLKTDPDDLRGWTILAQVYGTRGEYQKRLNALREIVRIDGPNADRLADLAEAEILMDGSLVSGSARTLLDQALAIQPFHRKARYYRTIAMEQSGEFSAAFASWSELKSISIEDNEWQTLVSQHLARLEDLQTKSIQQNEMIQGMVAGLKQRLTDDPEDLEGWRRLFRSYTVLKAPEQASALANDALARSDLSDALRSGITKLLDAQEEGLK